VSCNGWVDPAGCKTRDGRLWFPTAKGVVMVDPAHLSRNTVVPPMVMEEVLADGREAPPPRPGSRTVLPAGTGKIDLHYTANSLLIPKRVRFKYRMEGFDRDWVDAGTERTAHYTNLSPRSYTFRVIACNDDGVWNETGASLAFTLQPHYYQTLWFYGLCVLGVAAAGSAAQQARVKRLR